jgi:hypothetical protein
LTVPTGIPVSTAISSTDRPTGRPADQVMEHDHLPLHRRDPAQRGDQGQVVRAQVRGVLGRAVPAVCGEPADRLAPGGHRDPVRDHAHPRLRIGVAAHDAPPLPGAGMRLLD